MAFVNNNNFCSWIDSSVNTELTTNSAFTSGEVVQADNWNQSDVAPVGDNEQPWLWSSAMGGYENAIGAPNSTKGLSQEINIKDGNLYLIEFDIEELNVKDTTFYIYFTGGGNQLLQTVTINNERQSYSSIVFANADYSKIMGVFTTSTDGIHGRFYELKVSLISSDPCHYALPLFPGDAINMFMNFILDDTVVPFADLKLGLWSPALGIYLGDIVSLNQIVISGDNYSFYADEWTVPVLPKNENFRFVLFNAPATILYYSNSFRVVNNTEFTSIVRYRNSNDALGFLYETATTFFNEFRVDVWTGRANYNENVKGYDTHEGDFITVKSDIQKLREFQTRFFDEVANEAFFSMLSQSEFYIDEIRYKKSQDQSYDITWSDDDDTKIGNGIVNLLVDDYSAAVINCN